MDLCFPLNLRRWRRRRRLQEFKMQNINMRHLRDTSDPFSLPEGSFTGLYRLTKDLARRLIEELRPHMPATQRVTGVPIEIKVLCALHFFGQGGYQRSAGSDRNLSLSQPSVSRAVSEVTEVLNSPQILGKWIRFPRSRNERLETIQKNYEATGIPGVLGFVDGTHIAIKSPSKDEDLFFNRNKYHSMNTQIIADSNLRILNVFARFPGATHDAFVWGACSVRRRVVQAWEEGERCWLLGDSSYPHEPWLQTPIINAAEGTPEANYAHLHAKGRSAVERCISILKSRFRCILAAKKLQYQPRKVGLIVNACCVLHNVCILGGVTFEGEEVYDDPVLPDDGEPERQISWDTLEEAQTILEEARVVQEGIIEHLQH